MTARAKTGRAQRCGMGASYSCEDLLLGRGRIRLHRRSELACRSRSSSQLGFAKTGYRITPRREALNAVYLWKTRASSASSLAADAAVADLINDLHFMMIVEHPFFNANGDEVAVQAPTSEPIAACMTAGLRMLTCILYREPHNLATNSQCGRVAPCSSRYLRDCDATLLGYTAAAEVSSARPQPVARRNESQDRPLYDSVSRKPLHCREVRARVIGQVRS